MSATSPVVISCQSAGYLPHSQNCITMCTSLAIIRNMSAPLNTHLLDFAKCRKQMLNCVQNRWAKKLSKSDILAELRFPAGSVAAQKTGPYLKSRA